MSSRRDFLKNGAISLAGLSLLRGKGFGHSGTILPVTVDGRFVSRRPKLNDRKFVSEAVEEKIVEVKKGIHDDELKWLFENCYPNTLDTTVDFQMIDGKPDTFVITGDIHAMWLRDSSAQVWPYLPLAKQDSRLKELLAGVINRQTKCILIDPYANAFNYGATGSPYDTDLTTMKPELHERKWEVDSLCYPIRLAYGYWKTTGDVSCFDSKWHDAMKLVLKTFIQQQRKNGPGPYKFERKTITPEGTLANGGYGNPIKPVGLICSMFRPSDDATIFPFLIPSNYFAVLSLRRLTEMSAEILKDKELAEGSTSLADEVESAIRKYALVNHLDFGQTIAYEADGFGNQLFMDDANVPSLLSLPYLECLPEDDTVYQNTRRFVLSDSNPYFFKGKAGEGNGSPHTGLGKIWPMSIMMRAFTSSDSVEISTCLRTLIRSNAGTGFMHESFDDNDPSRFTRKWFAWANTLFGELVIKIYEEKPYLLKA